MRSRISSRSDSTSAPKMPKTRRSASAVVSIGAPWPASTRRPTPQVERCYTVLTRWARLRPRRSSFQTTSTLPFLMAPKQLAESRSGVALQVQRLGAIRL